MSRALRPLAGLALTALIGLVGAGCGSDAPSATGTAGSSGGGGGSGARDSTRDKAVRFAQCMRDNGVGEFPDPDASGAMTLDGVVNGSSLDPDGPTWRKAIDACKDLQPAGFTGHKATPEEQNVRLEFAQCMRDNGVEDFPDPAPGDALIDTTRIPSAAGRGARDIPGFDAATHKCGAAVADRLGLGSR